MRRARPKVDKGQMPNNGDCSPIHAGGIRTLGLTPEKRHLVANYPELRRSVTVTGNWRVIFRFEEGDALDLDLVDYH
jgi:hypothetical protein